jgi:hypothetical protein
MGCVLVTQNDITPPKQPLIGLFADLKAADAAARGLIALGLREDQLEIVDLTRLVSEYNPVFAKQVGIGTAAPRQIDLSDEAIEDFAREIADAVDLPHYLVNLGVPKSAAPYYASQIRDGLVLLVTTPAEEEASEAMRLLAEVGIRSPKSL